MTKLILDDVTVAKLMEVREKVELRDEKGRIVGHFLPGPPRDQNGDIITPISDEEALRIFHEQRGSGRTWPEIKKDLEAM